MLLLAQGKPDTPTIYARPKLPVSQDGEDIAMYLTSFEKVEEMLQLHKGTYAVRFSYLLRGKGAEFYVSLSCVVTSDYHALKRSLLSGSKKNPDGYRQDFSSAKIRE